MDLQITSTNFVPMFLAMLVLAIIPGPGVLTVVSRSIASGYRQGIVTTLGILCGDYVFIFLSLYGLAAIATSMENLFQLIKFVGVIYLWWLGLHLILQKPDLKTVELKSEPSSLKNFLAGFLTTLANPKAIVFYVSFFPAFINLRNLRAYDVLMSIIVVTLAVGGVMISYAYIAGKVSYLFQSVTTQRKLNQIAGCILLATGGWLIAKIQLW